MGTGGGTTTTQENAPWEGQIEYLRDIFSRAQDRSNVPLGYFRGSTVGPQSAATQEGQQAGLGMIRGAGQGPGYDYLSQVLGGDFLSPDSNPYLRQIGEQGGQDIARHYQTAIAPQNSLGVYGRSGSPAEQMKTYGSERALGESLSRFYSNLYGGQYQQERGLQASALGMVPGLDASRRSDITTGTQLGGGADLYQQRLLDDLVNRFQFEQSEEDIRLGRYGQLIGGVQPIQGTTKVTGPGGGGVSPSDIAGIATSLIGAVAASSSKTMKHEIDQVDDEEVLAKLKDLDIQVWTYTEEAQNQIAEETGQPASPYQHIGPYAEDLHEAYGVGDGKRIFFGDGIGISLAAIKGLLNRIEVLEELVLVSVEEQEVA